MRETRVDILNVSHHHLLPKMEDYLRHYEAVAPIKQPKLPTVTDEAYKAYKKRMEEQEKKNAVLDAMDLDVVPTGMWDGLTAEDRKKTSKWDRALSKAQHEVSSHLANSLTEPPTDQLLSIAETDSDEPTTSNTKLMYQISSTMAPPAELPIDSPFMDVDISAETLQTVSKYLNVETRASIKIDGDVEKPITDSAPKIPPSSGVPAFRCEMITEEDIKVYDGVTDTDSNGVRVSVDNCDFTPRDLYTLKPGKWINDNVVNGYMKLLQVRDSEKTDGPSCHFQKTFLTTNIYPEYKYNAVRKWTSARRLKNWGQSKATILDCDYVFFPVHLHASHWVLVVADLTKKTLRYYDSLGTNIPDTVTSQLFSTVLQFEYKQDNETYMLLKNICKYLVDEAADKLKAEWKEDDFVFEIAREMPQQHNSCDCGVYMVRTAKALSGQNALLYTTDEMQLYRILIMKELAAGKLL